MDTNDFINIVKKEEYSFKDYSVNIVKVKELKTVLSIPYNEAKPEDDAIFIKIYFKDNFKHNYAPDERPQEKDEKIYASMGRLYKEITNLKKYNSYCKVTDDCLLFACVKKKR